MYGVPSALTPRWAGVLFLTTAVASLAACASTADRPIRTVAEEGRNVVRLDADPDGSVNTHPARLDAEEVATLLRGVRSWERRNLLHRLIAGSAPRTRAFREAEIAFLAPAISRALAEATAGERVYFHLSSADPTGVEETTSGWLFIRDPHLHLMLSEVHDKHPPRPDISRYDRRMPDVPEASSAFEVTFEPEEYLVAAKSRARWFAPDQREELVIQYREALAALPRHALPPGSANPAPP